EADAWRLVSRANDSDVDLLITMGVISAGWDVDLIVSSLDTEEACNPVPEPICSEPRRRRGESKATAALRDPILAILERFEPDPITTRQTFYQLVQDGIGTNDKRFLRRAFAVILKMRRDGSIPYARIT